jgi:hypothetical protein
MHWWITGILVGIGAAMAFMLASKPAHALDANVRSACTGDYFSFCMGTTPGGSECKKCFRLHGPMLSAGCRAAIRASSEFGSEYRSAAHRYHQSHKLAVR